jgi:uncharacterized oxidoreductase
LPNINHSSLNNFLERIFIAAEATNDEARIVADSLTESNLLGHDSHGAIRVPQYVGMMRDGLIVPGNKPEIVKDEGSTLIVDGHFTFGQVIVRQAMTHAIEKARERGIVQIGIRRTNHIGRMGEYAAQAAEAGLLGWLVANNSGAGQIVTPVGGIEGRLATNPIAFAAPWKDGECFLLDMTTSIAPEGKVRVAHNKGEQLPEGWLLDPQGRPSRNPADLYGPPRGSLMPLGGAMGHKGFGLGLMVEILGGLLSGDGYSRPDPTRIGNGVFGFVADLECFMTRAEFEDHMQKLLAHIKSCPTRDGVDEVFVPGEPEHRERRNRLVEGIPLDDETWRQLTQVAAELGVDVPDMN